MMDPKAKRAVEDHLDQRSITRPQRLANFASADLPPAAAWFSHAVFCTDLKVIAVSDGTDWIRQDTGVAI